MSDVRQELEHVRKLATANPDKRFDRLYRLVCKPEFLMLAWDDIKRNKGSRTPGVDGQTRDDVDEALIGHLSRELKTGTYRPKPLRRKYIPKKNGKKRPLGIPTIRDRIAQSAAALILNALYEPNFLACSHGFRPNRCTISALRQVGYCYKAGADWIIEGDIKSCFDAMSHTVMLDTLRKRIKDERFITLIARFLTSGVMDELEFRNTYSGTPQGGIVSPVLANIVLHEFDVWMETEAGCNAPRESNQAYRQRQTPEYRRLTGRLKYVRMLLKRGTPFPKGHTAADLKAEEKRLVRERQQVSPSTRRRVTHYVRYADDFLVILCAASREEAETLKERMACWLQEKLGLTLSTEKTLVTHASEKLRFLGYDVQGLRNPNGTRWARFSIPVDAKRHIVERVKQAVRYRHAPELDTFMNVNAVIRGWSNYYRYAHDARESFGWLTTIVYWQAMTYLARKHNFSPRQIMRQRYRRDPETGHMALFTQHPGGNPYFVWNKPPKYLSMLSVGGYAEDQKPYISTMWADGHSVEKKAQLVATAEGRCEECGQEGALYAHHPKRLSHASPTARARAASGYEQQGKLLCRTCHLAHHQGDSSHQ